MQNYSFYYRESLNLKALFPEAYSFSLLYPNDNIVISEGILRLKDPEALNPESIHILVRIYRNRYDYFKIEVNIRCWRNDEYELKEVTKFKAFLSSRFYRYLRSAINRIYPLSFNTHLLTENGISYYSKNRHLIKIEGGRMSVISKMPVLLHPRFYDFLLFGSEAFLRTFNRIYLSCNNMTSWKVIYEGKRAIKDSMVWVDEEKALLFIEYSSGLKQNQHRLLKYYVESGKTRTILTFFTTDEYLDLGKQPYCRHIHVLKKDPFSEDIYMGVGDSDDESAIYRSIDNGNTFERLGGGSQVWRTLSFLFTEDSVLWNTDSPDPQYLSCIKRKHLGSSIKDEDVIRYPIFNSASWNSFEDLRNNMYIMSSNCEGMLYDNKCRVYGIVIEDGKPTVYCLLEESPKRKEIINQFDQLFVLGKDNSGRYWFYDTRRNYYRQFMLVTK